MSLLTKSDFKACADCATRLYFRKERFPSAKDDDEYLQLLADGGFMVEFIAKAQYPGGHDLAHIKSADEAFARTKALLGASQEVIIFEAAANHERFHARIDILAKRQKTLHLIEVKSSSVDPNDEADDARSPLLTKNGVASRWLPYVQDVAFQTIVLMKAFPEYMVVPFLAVVDKSFVATEAETLGKFSLKRSSANPGGKHSRPEVTYLGDTTALVNSKIIKLLEAQEAVKRVWEEVEQKATELAGLLTESSARWTPPDLGHKYRECRECEYRTAPTEHDPRSGFVQCWGKLAESPAHILDLHRVSQIESKECPDPVPGLLKKNSSTYLDLTKEQLGKADSAWTKRRIIQWDGMRANREQLPRDLQRELQTHSKSPGYPFHFMDFEACNISLPHHAGLHPYERVAFQWSCHTLKADNSVWHHEWLNEDLQFPNFRFAQELRKRVGDTGTVYVWSHYEQGTLKKILEQLQLGKVRGLPDTDPELAHWIDSLLGPADARGKRVSPRIRDLHDLAYAYYFHPRMKGRTSIKVVLPAIWEADEKLRNHPCFKSYHKMDETGNILEPYQTLDALPLGDGEDEVREGTGAVRVYQDLIFNSDAADKQNRVKLLKQYCQLDTAAMLMIWVHWLGRYEIVPAIQ